MEPSDHQDLLEQCADGRSPAAWENFVARFGPRIEGGVKRALRSARYPDEGDEVEERVQDVYLRLLENGARRLLLCRAASEGETGGYLTRLAENLTRDHLRASRAVKRGGKVTQPAIAATYLPDPGPSPEEHAQLSERLRHAFERCLAIGPRTVARRNVAILHMVAEGRTSREVAAALGGGLAPSSVDSLLHRIRSRLRGARCAA